MFKIQKFLVIYLVTCFIREYHCERSQENDAMEVVNLSVIRCQSAVRNLTILLDSFLSYSNLNFSTTDILTTDNESLNLTTVAFTFFSTEFSTTPEVPLTSESIEFLPTEKPPEISTLINHFTTTVADMTTFIDEITSIVTDATVSPHKTNIPISTETTESSILSEGSTEILTMSEITTNHSYSTESHFHDDHTITTMANYLSTDLTTNEVTDTNMHTIIDSQQQTSNPTDSSTMESLNPETTSMVNVSESTLVDSNIGADPKLSESFVVNSSSVVSGGSPDGNHSKNGHGESVNVTSHRTSVSTIDPSRTLNGEDNFRRKRSIYEETFNWGLYTNLTLSKIDFYLSNIIENPMNITHSQALDVQTIYLQTLVNDAYKNSELVDLSKLSMMYLRAQYILSRINETMTNLQQEIEGIAHAKKQTTAAISLVSTLLLLVIIGLIFVFLRPIEHVKGWRASKRGSIRVSLTPVTRSSSFSSDGISLDNASYISHNDRIDQLSTLQMFERNPMPSGVHRTQSGSSRSESVFSVASTIQLSNDQFVSSAMKKQMKLSRI